MIYVSMVEIFVKARESLSTVMGERVGYMWTVAAFFLGILFIAVIDKLIPAYENPHELNVTEKIEHASEREKAKLLRMGLFSALAIGIHNFPEGLATFMSGLTNPTLGISIAVAIAIHNIPEGLAVSAPIYYATKSRKKASCYRSSQVSLNRSVPFWGISCFGPFSMIPPLVSSSHRLPGSWSISLWMNCSPPRRSMENTIWR